MHNVLHLAIHVGLFSIDLVYLGVSCVSWCKLPENTARKQRLC